MAWNITCYVTKNMNEYKDKNSFKPYILDYLYEHGVFVNNKTNAHCINHYDENPSMGYNPKTYRVHCYACGFEADIYDCVGIFENLHEFKQQFSFVSQKYQGVPVAFYGGAISTEKDYSDYYNSLVPVSHCNYLQSRGISENIVNNLNGIFYDEIKHQIVFKIDSHSYFARCLGNGTARYISYGGNRCKEWLPLTPSVKVLIITEGAIDALSVFQCIYGNVEISVLQDIALLSLNSTGNARSAIDYIKARKKSDFRVLLALDNDVSGKSTTELMYSSFKLIGCFPENIADCYSNSKDVNEELCKNRYGLIEKLLKRIK